MSGSASRKLARRRARTSSCWQLDGENWIADAGFGGSYVPPLPLVDGAIARTLDLASHRLRHLGLPDGEWILERRGSRDATDGRARPGSGWQAQYTFDLAPVMESDLAQANHWTATAPRSRFVQSPVASLPLADGFAALSNEGLKITRGNESHLREIADATQWRETVREIFGIGLSAEEAASLAPFPKRPVRVS